jgi:hypothetical protein
LVHRVNAHVQTRHFQDADGLLEEALDALEEKAPAPVSPARRRRVTGRKSLVGLFLRVKASISPATSRQVDLS